MNFKKCPCTLFEWVYLWNNMDDCTAVSSTLEEYIDFHCDWDKLPHQIYSCSARATSVSSFPCWFDVLLYSSPCHSPLSSLRRYNSILLWYFQRRGSLQSDNLTVWFDWKHGKSHAGPGIQSLASSLTHSRPINPLLNPKAFFMLWSMCHPLLQIPLSLLPPPSSLCVCVCLCVCPCSLNSGTAGIIIL